MADRPKAPEVFILTLRKYIEDLEDKKSELEEKEDTETEIEEIDEEISETESVLDFLGEP